MNKGRLAVAAVLAGLSLPVPSSGVLTKPLVASWLDAQGRVWATPGEGSPWVRLEGVDQARATATSSGLVFMVDDAGRVLQWSGGGRGARRISGIADGRKLSCGPGHCLSLTSDGSVYQWSARATEATRVAGLEEVVEIAAGSDHSLAVTETGEVFGWGQNDSGQLGQVGAASSAPLQVDGLSEAISVGAGSRTSVALLRSGEVVVWGRNDLGQLGLNRAPVLAPTAIPHLRANSIAASADQVWLTTPVGELIELSDTETAGGNDGPESLGLYPWSRGAISLEEDGSLQLLGPTTSRVPASIFEQGLSRSLMETPAPESIRGASTAAIVIGATAPSEADQALGARLEALGFVHSYIEDRAADPTSMQGAGLIVFAPSARASRLSRALAGLQVPMLALDPFVSVRLGLTPSDAISSGVSSGSRTVVVNAERQIGRALGEGEFEARPHPQWMSWAQAAGADVIAVASSGHANVFTLDEGAESFGGKTPERRAVLLLGANPDAYHASAWVFFDAATRWSVRAAPSAGAGRLGRQSVFSLTGGTGTILLVVGNLSLSAEDNAYKTRMEAMGFTVETKLASASGAADATGKKLVYVSGSSPNGDILAKFLNVTVPVLIQTTGIVDDMLMTSFANRGTDAASTQVTVQAPSHAIAVPLTGTVTVGGVAASQSWGIGSGSAQHILAPFANSGHYALFVYPSGASMVGASAPSRRVFYGLSTAANFTTPGLDLFERMIFWATGTNVAPVVNAGPNRPAEEGISITLNGSVVDDGLPGATTIAWTKTNGPSVGTVTFGTPSAATTTATFSKTGVYTLRLTANDGAGPVFDETQITVQLPGVNAPPVVNAGADKSVLVGATTLNGSASDDSFPVGSTLSVAWSRVSGPGSATFGTPSAVNTTLTLSAAGTHVIRLTATESGPGGLTVFDDVVITASAPVLLVVGNTTTLNASDAALKARFEALGFPVTVQLGSATVANDANGKALVWASASTPNVDIGSKFLNKGIPVVIQTAGSVDDMGMTPDDSASRGSAAGQSQATVTAPLNWLAAGLSGTLLTSNAPGNYDWGLPAAAAQKVAAMPSLPTQSTLFAYAAGATMSSGLPAAGRRLFFGYQDATTLSIAGWRLFDQAVLWLASKNGAPIVNAGSDQTLAWSSPSVVASLSGVIVDDGLPSGGVLATSWAALSGPVTVAFGSATAPSTTATFTAPGDYVLKLSATESVTAGPQPVSWTSGVGVAISGATLTKTASTAAWDSGALSTQAIGSGDGYVEATISGTTSFWMFGLGSGNTDATYTDIEYAIYVRGDGAVQVFESGALKFSSISYAPGDIVRVAIESGVVRYRKNGTLFYTSLVSPAGLYPFSADSSIFTAGAAITSPTIGFPGLSSVLGGSDLVTVSVVDGAQNAAPVVSVGADRSVRLPATLSVNAAVADDGLPVSPGVTSVAWTKVAGPGAVTFNPAAAASTGVTFSAAGIYVLRATATDGGLSSSDDLTVVVDAAETALFVVGNAVLDAGDAVAKARLEALGFSVTVTTNSVAAEATGKRVVVISSSVNAGAVSGTFTNVSVPVVVLENFVFDDMGMTGPEATHAGTATGTQTAMTGTSHPLAALMTGSPTVYNSTGDIGWGIPGGNAIKASALTSDATKATVFGYEAGTAMFTGISPARRVGLFLRPQSANSKGLAFFDAAVRWATERRAPALLVTGNTSLTAADQALVARLSAQRLSVSVTTAAALSAPDTAGKALVVVSSTADAVALGNKLRDTNVPVLVSNSAAFPGLGMTGSSAGIDYGSTSGTTLTMIGALHPLAAGLSGPQATVTTSDSLAWGIPASSAVRIALAPSASSSPTATGVGTITDDDATMTCPVSAAPGGTIAVQVTGGSSATDWLGVYTDAGAAPSSYLSWAYVPLPRPQTVNMTAPSTPGIYNIRLWPNNGSASLLGSCNVVVATTPTLTVNNVTVSEGNAGTSSATFTVSLTPAAGGTVTVAYSTANGTASSGSDYVSTSGTLTFTAGQMSRTVSVTVNGDTSPETSETFFLNLASPTGGAVIGDSQGLGTITDDDAWMTCPVSAAPGGSIPVQVTGGSSATDWLGVYTDPGAAPSAYLSWAYVPLPRPQTVNMTAPSTPGTYNIRLWPNNGSASLLGSCNVVVATTPTLTINNVTVSEGNAGTTSATFTVNLSPATGGTVTVAYATADVTAAAGSDYGSTMGTLTFTAGQTPPTVSVMVNGDTSPEAAETFLLSLGSLNGAHAIFGYEFGSSLAGVTSPDRRIAIANGPISASNLTTAGASLLDAAIQWALSSDRDGDGLGVFDEIVAGADPSNPDTNGDGVLDGAAVRSGLSPTSLDMDGDGLSNQQEQTKGTNPFIWDTDGDTVGDAADCFPLNPLQVCAGADGTPPIITLTTPPGAVLISSVPPSD